MSDNQDSQLFEQYAELISLDMGQVIESQSDLLELFESLSEIAACNQKGSPVKAGRWFSWLNACEEQVPEFFAVRMLLQHQFPRDQPDVKLQSFSKLRLEMGGMRLGLQCYGWSVWFGIQVLRLGQKPIYTSYCESVEGVKSPAQGLRRTIQQVQDHAWMASQELKGLIAVFSQKDQFQKILQYHALSRRHLDDAEHRDQLGKFINQLFFYIATLMCKRSSALSKLNAPPECYAEVLSSDPAASDAALAFLLEDWRLLCLAEQSPAAQDLAQDLRSTISAPVRLVFLCAEANKMSDAYSILECMLKIMPDSKVIEDLHGCVKKDALANSSRRQSPKQVQHVITNSNILESRGVKHPAQVDKSSFLQRWRRTKTNHLKQLFHASVEKLQPWYSKIMNPKKLWPSLSEEHLAKSSCAWQWLRLFAARNLKQHNIKLTDS